MLRTHRCPPPQPCWRSAYRGLPHLPGCSTRSSSPGTSQDSPLHGTPSGHPKWHQPEDLKMRTAVCENHILFSPTHILFHYLSRYCQADTTLTPLKTKLWEDKQRNH